MTLHILYVALNTFREAVRNRILYAIGGFFLLMLAFSTLLGRLSISENIKVITDMGFSSLAIFGCGIAVYLGIGLLYRDVEKRTIYMLLSKPVHRFEVLVGKYLGLILVLATVFTAQSILFGGLLWSNGAPPTWPLLGGLLLCFIEIAVLTAICVFFSAYSSPFMTAMFTIGCYVVGYTVDDLLAYGEGKVSATVLQAGKTISWCVPHFEYFNIRERIVHHLEIAPYEILSSFGYGMVWVLLLLIGASFVFKRKDLV